MPPAKRLAETPLENLAAIRRRVIAEINEQGIREIARLAELNPMRVSRFVNGQGGDDARTLFILAAAVGLYICVMQGPPYVNQVAAALSRYNVRRGKRGSKSQPPATPAER